MIMISPVLILMLITIVFVWYNVCKYLIATGISSRKDMTMPVFIMGIVFFIIVVIIVYLGLVFFIRPG